MPCGVIYVMLIDFHTHNNELLKEKSLVKDNSLAIYSHSIGNTIDNGGYISLGLHPWDIVEENIANEISFIKQHVDANNVIYVGECGIDKCYANITPIALQQHIFELHIQISETHSKPLLIHCVRAVNEIINLKKKHKPKQQWIVHGFNNNVSTAKMLVGEGIMLSFGAALLNSNSNARKVIATLDNKSFVLETDGKDTSIYDIYQAAANIRGTTLKEIELTMEQNFERIVGHKINN